MSRTADVVICGAGIAGIAAAYYLAVRRGIGPVVLVDERAPLSLTSDKSAESYRNWWPGPGDAMVGLMNRSIDLLEDLARESGNVFRMNRRGYLFATADPAGAARLARAAEDGFALGVGPLRHHRTAGDYLPSAPQGVDTSLTGADVISEPALVRRHFPYLAPDTIAVVHARRAGWLSGHELGTYLLERARAHGVRLVEGRVERIDTAGGRIRSVSVAGRAGMEEIGTPRVVLAGGPFLASLGRMLDVEIPVYCERHAKVAFEDPKGAVPRDAPMLIWADRVELPWTDEERGELAASAAHRHLLGEMPVGVHGRPEGGEGSPWVLAIWTYRVEPVAPTFPLAFDPEHPELVLRGMSRMVPGLRPYLERLPRVVVDGGYYTKTRENRLLAGPLSVPGAYVLGALSGYGIMASNGAADLLADHIAERPLPPYASAFGLDRYDDPAYRRLLATWGDSGQL
ncbi:MAG: FAD-binding oxidoreductase [Candidatus Rokubacteria bacterium]|nr:FAD-binding oxidoreductase [Candidatus Rokubacteria bacterium]